MVNLEVFLFKSYSPRSSKFNTDLNSLNSRRQEMEFINKTETGQTCFTSVRPLEKIENVPVHWHTAVPFGKGRLLVGGTFINLVDDREKTFGSVIDIAKKVSSDTLNIPISVDVDSVHQIVAFKRLILFCTNQGHLYITTSLNILRRTPPILVPLVKVGSSAPEPAQDTVRSLWVYKAKLYFISETQFEGNIKKRISSLPLSRFSKLSGASLIEALQQLDLEHSEAEFSEINDFAVTRQFVFVLTSKNIIKLNRKDLRQSLGESGFSELGMYTSCDLICANNRQIFAFNGKRAVVLTVNLFVVDSAVYSPNVIKQPLRAKMLNVCGINLTVLLTWNEVYLFLRSYRTNKVHFIASPKFSNTLHGRIFDIVSINKRNSELLVFGEFERRTLCHISFA
jgi:hypothetical protein